MLWTSDGGRASGAVSAVSAELVGLTSGESGRTWLVRGALAGVSPLSDGFDAGVASDDRGPTSSTTVAGLLANLAEDRSAAAVRCGGHEISGRVVGAGADVVTMRLADGRLTYLPVGGLSVLRLA